MNDVSLQLLLDLSIISDRDPPELTLMYGTAADSLDLRAVDYLTIRDLVRCSGSNDVSLHLLLLAMFISLYEGSVCLRLDRRSLEKKLNPFTGRAAEGLYREILECPDRHPDLVHSVRADSPGVADDPREAYKPLILLDRAGERSLYFQKFYSAERTMAGSLSAILARPPVPENNHTAIAAAMAAVLREKPVMVNGAPALLNREQMVAVLLPLLNNFVILSGGPGTGKTFIVLTLLRIMARTGVPPHRIRIAAPTGRAAQRLTDSIRRGIATIAVPDPLDSAIGSLQGTTIHRLLGYGASRDDFFYTRYNPIPADLVVIDEASMIDIVLLGKLFQAIDSKACLVLLGDRNQLPSVEAGAVLADLIPGDHSAHYSAAAVRALSAVMPGIELSRTPETGGDDGPAHMEDRVVILHNSYRSEETITAVARKIIAQDISVIDDIPEFDLRGGFPEHGVRRIEPGTGGAPYASELHRILGLWTAWQYETMTGEGMTWKEMIAGVAGTDLTAGEQEPSGLLKKIMSSLDNWRILTPIRSGLSGATGINDHIRNALAGTLDPSGTGRMYSGAPIIITRNEYDRGLFNGDVGLVLMSGDGRYYGVFDRFDGMRLYPVETLPPYDLSYAITVHKSQGSEYGRVLLILPGTITGSLLTTEILYTGLTRAKNLAIIYASKSTLTAAIQNRTERQSGAGIYTGGRASG